MSALRGLTARKAASSLQEDAACAKETSEPKKSSEQE
jgi:hypothetical protein